MRFKRWLTLLLTLALCAGMITGARADELDDTLSAWLGGEGETRLSATFQLDALMPFEESKLALINNVARYLQFHASLSDADTSLAMSVGEETIFTFAETVEGEATRLVTSLLPNRSLVAGNGSALALLADAGEGLEGDAPFSLPDAVTELEGRYKAVVDACAPYAEEKKANYNIKSIGRARLSQTARLPADADASVLLPVVAALSCGMDDSWRLLLSEAVSFKKGFVVALYRTAEGEDMALYMKGSLLLADGAELSLKFQWAFLRGDERTDTYTCDATLNRKPKLSRAVKASGTSAVGAQKLAVDLSSDVTVKTSGETLVTSYDVALSGKAGATLSGSVTTTRKQTAGGKTTQSATALAPDLRLSEQDGVRTLAGTVVYTETRDKLQQLAVTVTLGDTAQAAQPDDPFSVKEDDDHAVEVVILSGDGDVLPQASTGTDEYLVGATPIGLTAFTVPAEPVEVTLTDARRDALLTEASQTLAGRLLVALSALPGDDAALLWNNMTETDIRAAQALFEGR